MKHLIATLLAGLVLSGVGLARAEENRPYPKVEKLLSSGETILGQTLSYPEGGKAQITSVIVTLMPGEKTSIHKHQVPLFGYVLEGELSVHYEATGKTEVIRAGTAMLEAFDSWHYGWNSGDTPMRILAVFMGADGQKNTIVK